MCILLFGFKRMKNNVVVHFFAPNMFSLIACRVCLSHFLLHCRKGTEITHRCPLHIVKGNEENKTRHYVYDNIALVRNNILGAKHHRNLPIVAAV